MTTRKRRHFSPQAKRKILRLHLLEARPISALCDEHGIHPTLFYQWHFYQWQSRAIARQPA